VIRSFRNAETERIFLGIRSKKFQAIEKVAARKLFQLYAAKSLLDPRSPGNSLEALTDDRAGQHSIRINDRYRLCFAWENGDACHVEIVDLSLTGRNIMTKPPHPGETIKEDYLVPLGMSVNRLAVALGIGTARLNEIVRGKRGITADTALRLARCFGTSAEFWLNLQSLYDLRMAERRVRARIEREVTPLKVA
jgi:addiction module HigA family antidote